jgi:iron complex transport system substrate-binding protein
VRLESIERPSQVAWRNAEASDLGGRSGLDAPREAHFLPHPLREFLLSASKSLAVAVGAASLAALLLAAPVHATPAKPSGTHYPLSITWGGVKTTIKAKPVRIISLSPSATELFYGIGAGKQILAVDDYSNFPKRAPMSKLSAFTPNLEAIAAMKPDLVLLSADATKADEVRGGLSTLGIPVLMEHAPTGLKDVYTEIRVLGNATNQTLGAKALVTKMSTRIRAIIKSVHLTKPVRIFHELDNTLYSATSKTFIGQIYRSFDPTLVNIADTAAGADSSGYPQLSAEYLIASNPQAVFLADAQYGETAAGAGQRPGWATIDAVKSGNVIELPADIPSRWGPRLVEFYRIIGAALAKVV